MITLQKILQAQSNILDDARVKIVRHQDNREEYRHIMKDRPALLEYQKIQGKDIFKDCDYIISFIGDERKRSRLIGVFKVGQGKKLNDGTFYYDVMEPVQEFEDLADRVVIDWGDNTRAWHQWYDRQSKEVIEILPKGYIGNFPGLLEIVLDFEDLQKMIKYPEANFEWRHRLSAVNGIYMILDNHTGMQYIGSAGGKEGIWQRWTNYADTSGTGDNKELKALIEKDADYHRHFRFSILQTLPGNISGKEIIDIENLYKKKLGSKVHGLNRN